MAWREAGNFIFLRLILVLPRLVPHEVPGRGLEPLWISPPDPKSGASANFATLANCNADERRCGGRFGQIALVNLLRFLRQIGRCQHKK